MAGSKEKSVKLTVCSGCSAEGAISGSIGIFNPRISGGPEAYRRGEEGMRE